MILLIQVELRRIYPTIVEQNRLQNTNMLMIVRVVQRLDNVSKCLTVFQQQRFDQSSPFWLNPSPTNQREGFNPARGTVTFSAIITGFVISSRSYGRKTRYK